MQFRLMTDSFLPTLNTAEARPRGVDMDIWSRPGPFTQQQQDRLLHPPLPQHVSGSEADTRAPNLALPRPSVLRITGKRTLHNHNR